MGQIFYYLAVACLVAVFFGAANSKIEIAAAALSAAILFFFMGAVLNSLNDILKEIKDLRKSNANDIASKQEAKQEDK